MEQEEFIETKWKKLWGMISIAYYDINRNHMPDIKKFFTDVINESNQLSTPQPGDVEGVIKIIDKEIETDIKLNEIFNTDAWWFSQEVGEKFHSHITGILESVKKKILEQNKQ